VLIGPPGVFVLESKNLNGIVSVHHSVLHARWHEDPDDGYENRSFAPRARASAAELHDALRADGATADVQPVIVLWAEFEQRSILSSNVAWIA
jgi:Nuclease-related domain